MNSPLHLKIRVKSAGHCTLSGWSLTTPYGARLGIGRCYNIRRRPAPVRYVTTQEKILKNRPVPGRLSNSPVECKSVKSYDVSLICDHSIIPGHHRSSSGMNRISTVRPLGETVANRYELCSRWRYGDSPLDSGLSRRRASVVPTLVGRTTVWLGSSRWMPVKLRYDNGTSRWMPIELQKQYLNYGCLFFTQVICINLNNFLIK